MSLSTKILIFLGAALTLGLLSFIVYKQIEMSQRQQAIEEKVVKQKELLDGIVRSQSEYTTKKDMEQFIKDNGANIKTIKEDLDKLNAEIKIVNLVVTNSRGFNGTNLSSTSTEPNHNPISPTVNCNGQDIPCPNADPFEYMKNKQNFALNEKFDNVQIPVGQVGFSAWKKEPWDVNILPREYNVISVVGTDENQRHYFYNKFTIKTDNKSYDVKINSAQTKEVYPEATFSWFNPRLYLTSGGNINVTTFPINGSFNAGATIQLMSYGKFKKMPDISIFQVGASYQSSDNQFSATINPISVNFNKIIPNDLINNTYIGPSVHIGTSKNIFMGLNLNVGL